MKQRHVLFSAYGVPQADRDSGSRRLSHLVEFLREAGWLVSFWATNGLGEMRYVRELQQAGIAVHDGAKENLSDVACSTEFDLAILAFWPVAELQLPVLRRYLPDTPVIVDSVDLHFLREARKILLGGSKTSSPSLLSEDFGAHLVAELNAYVAADAVMTVSQKESDFLNAFIGDSSIVRVVPDCEEMALPPIPLRNRRGILSVASYQHAPNIEALEFLCGKVLPLVDEQLLAQHPVYVVGNGLDDKLRAMANGLKHVHMIGWVPSVEPYFAQARISVIPLLYGAGTKRKTIQSLMAGTPAVSTHIGAEGLDLQHEQHILIADNAVEFARSIERLLQDDALWMRLASEGRSHVAARHGRDAARTKFLDTIEQTLQRPTKPAMLADQGREKYWDRLNYQYYQRVLPAIREMVTTAIPADATVVVASEGINALLRLEGRAGLHFPQNADGTWRRNGFADSRGFIEHLASLASKGAEYFVLPEKLLGQFEKAYGDLRVQLDRRYEKITDSPGLCVIYALGNTRQRGSNRNGDIHVREDLADSLPVPSVKLIAFYLPQFHPIPENDLWWGEGFTEWRNVAKAVPLFPGHAQPQLPADLGFYDLRLPETRREQADLARAHGIHGFCYYHYWFNGKRLLERPFDEVLASGDPDFPFCLCWANEPWSRRWDGSEKDVLQPQSYSTEDDLAHIRRLLTALSDPRAITIDGKPVFIVYRGRDLPDPLRTTDLWRREVERAGMNGLYLMTVETGYDVNWDATKAGFDAKIGFQPQFSLLNTVPRLPLGPLSLHVFDYQKAWPVLANPEPVPYLRYETVFPSWDNSARKGEQGWVLHNSTPAAYEQWLRLAVERAAVREPEERVVFLNAWNEWAEGCHLEPDRKHGMEFLEATARVLRIGNEALPSDQRPVSRARELLRPPAIV